MLNLLFSLIDHLTGRLRSERGEVSIEYVLVGGLAAAAIIAGMAVLFPAVGGWFNTVADRVTNGL